MSESDVLDVLTDVVVAILHVLADVAEDTLQCLLYLMSCERVNMDFRVYGPKNTENILRMFIEYCRYCPLLYEIFWMKKCE
jgi:hypothetical protein